MLLQTKHMFSIISGTVFWSLPSLFHGTPHLAPPRSPPRQISRRTLCRASCIINCASTIQIFYILSEAIGGSLRSLCHRPTTAPLVPAPFWCVSTRKLCPVSCVTNHARNTFVSLPFRGRQLIALLAHRPPPLSGSWRGMARRKQSST